MTKSRGVKFWLAVAAVVIYVVSLFLSAASYSPARATACTVTFHTNLGGGTNDTFALYSSPLSYVVYTGQMDAELPAWWGGPGIPGYGIQFDVSGGCSTLRVASAAWHIAADTGHYWEGWDPGSHNADGDMNSGTAIPIDINISYYGYTAGNLAHTNPYDYVTFELYTTEGDPAPTVTPTALYTAVPPVEPSGQMCAALGDSNARFLFDMDWATYYTEFADASNLVSLLMHPGSFATLQTTLKASRRYSWEIIYASVATGATGPLNLEAGDQNFALTLYNDTADHTQTNAAIALGNEPIELRLERPTTATGDVVIKYLCFTTEGDSVTLPGDSETGQADECVSCDPPLSFADVLGLLNWLVCNIRNVIICVVLPALGEVVKFIVLQVQYALSFFTWLVETVSGGVNWVAETILAIIQNLGGQLANGIFGSSNALHTSGIADDMNIAASGARDLPTVLGNEISRLNSDLQSIFENSRTLPEMIINLVGLAANAIMTVLGLIPLAIEALADGLSSAAEPVSGGLMCSTPGNALYAPCLGFYVLENTVFQGPVRFLIPILMGAVVFDMLTWAVAAIKDSLAR